MWQRTMATSGFSINGTTPPIRRKGPLKNGVKPKSRSLKIKFRRQSQPKQETNKATAQAGLGCLQEAEDAQCLDYERAISGLGQSVILARHQTFYNTVHAPKNHRKVAQVHDAHTSPHGPVFPAHCHSRVRAEGQ